MTPLSEKVLNDLEELRTNTLTDTVSGTSLSITDSANAKIRNVKIYGAMEQDGEPTPDEPVEIQTVSGDIYTTMSNTENNYFNYKYFYENYSTVSASEVGRCVLKLEPSTTYTISTNIIYQSYACVFAVSSSNLDFTPLTSSNGISSKKSRNIKTDSNGYITIGIYVSGERIVEKTSFRTRNCVDKHCT